MFILSILNTHKSLLKSFWIERFQLPSLCSQSIEWTCEHIVPKSVIPKSSIHNNLHNLILLPKLLNNARSNYCYTNDQEKIIKKVSGCHGCKGTDCHIKGLLVTSTKEPSFNPPELWRGELARAVLYMTAKYPTYSQVIESKVLSRRTAYKWLLTYPPDWRHIEWDKLVYSVQGDHNIYTLWSYKYHKSHTNTLM